MRAPPHGKSPGYAYGGTKIAAIHFTATTVVICYIEILIDTYVNTLINLKQKCDIEIIY